MSYEVFKKIVSKEKYFKSWEYEKIVTLTESLKNGIYEKYVAKCKVFQRDNFTCQNIDGLMVNVERVKIYHMIIF